VADTGGRPAGKDERLYWIEPRIEAAGQVRHELLDFYKEFQAGYHCYLTAAGLSRWYGWAFAVRFTSPGMPITS
jgi:hypothetical protein